LGSAKRRYTFLVAYGLLALAVLTKGLVGLLIPAAIVSIWLALTGRWREWSSYHVAEGSLLFCVLAVPWHVLAALRTPAFTWYYFVHEQFLRYLQPLHNREQPFWFFIFIFVVGFFPFTLLVPRALLHCLVKPWRQLKNQEPEGLLLGVWALFVPLFYSFSHSKLAPYILPCFFPWAIMVARYIDVAWSAPQVYTGLRVAAQRFSYLLLAAAVVLPPLAWWGFQLRDKLFWLPAFALVVCLVLAFLGIQRCLRGSPQKAWLLALCALGPIMVAVQPMVGAARFPGTKAHAQFLRQYTQPGVKIFQIFNYYQDFNPYLGRLTHVVDRPDEQCFGLSLEDQSERYPEPAVFLDAWSQTQETWYGIIRTKYLSEFTQKVGADKVHPLFQTQQYWVISNHPPSPPTTL
jgi:4-amino-4-deoxy-L-arabinose transferase-like glycosyltransferase